MTQFGLFHVIRSAIFLCAGACVVGDTSAQDITTGLRAFYTFDGGALDQSGNGNHAAPGGNYQFLAVGLGSSGGALRTTGDNSLFYSGGGFLALPTFGSYMNSGFTVSVWAKDEVIGLSPVNEESYISFGAVDLPRLDIALNSASRVISYSLDTGVPGTVRTITKSVNLSTDLGQWKHLVLTYSPGRMVAYFNGTKVGEASGTFPLFPVSVGALGRHWWNGGGSSAARMSATFDNVRIYSRALSDADVQQLYSNDGPTTPASISLQPASRTVVEGQSVTFSVTAAGTPPFSYQWKKDGAPIENATGASFTIVGTRTSDAGSYTVSVSNSVSSVISSAATLTVKPGNPGRLANISIRTATASGGGTLIVGFVLGGEGTSGQSSLLTRVSGPALLQFGVTGTIPDPVLSLFDGGRLIGSNDNWGGGATLTSAASGVGAFPFPSTSRDSALLSGLTPSNYTAQAFDVNGAAGVALVEVYDAEPTFSYNRPRLVNVSARANAGEGAATMIAGFSIQGTTPMTVLIRGIGPALTQFNVPGVLSDPKLTLFKEATVISVNDNWGDVSAGTISGNAVKVGAFPLPANSADSAIVATLQPGTYTVHLTGVRNAVGIALIEIYEVP